MALKAKISKDEHGKLSEELQKEYRQQGEDYVLDVTEVGGFALEDVSGLRSALKKERDAARNAAEKLEEFGDLDAKKARAALKKIEDLGDDASIEKRAQTLAEQKMASLAEKHQQEVEAAKSRAEKLAASLQKSMVTDKLVSEITKQGGDPELLLPHLSPFVKSKEINPGEVDVFVVDADGTEAIGGVKDGSTQRKTLDQLVTEFKSKPKFAGMFEGSGSSGGGAGGNNGGSKAPIAGTKSQPRRILASDQQAINSSVDAIAKGEAIVVDE